jgi:hypothetical protein
MSSTNQKSHAVAWSLGLVVACGLLLGYYTLETYFAPRQRQYQLDFGRAQWIEPAEPGPTAYFRTEVFLNAQPEQAWLEVAAMDNFKVIVNNHSVAFEDSVKTRVAGIYDIKKRLRSGTNVIAVSIARTSYPGAAQLLLRGFIKQAGGKVTELYSDEHWRVTTETGIVQGSEEWTSSVVQAELWPLAIRSAINGKAVPIAWVDVNPLLLQLAPTGSWLLSQNAASEATFSTSLQADRSRQETWLQVASSGDVDLVINGHLITSAVDFSTIGTRLPHLPRQSEERSSDQTSRRRAGRNAGQKVAKVNESAFEKATLEAIDVSYWIKAGRNSIVATVRADHQPASLFVSGFLVNRDGSVRRFQTDSDWQVSDRVGDRISQSQRAVEFGEDGSAPWGFLPQEMARPLDHAGFATIGRNCLVVGLTAAAVMALWLIVSALVAKRGRELFRRTLIRDALFHAPIIAGLLLLLLPNYDARFPAEWSFAPAIVIAAIVALLGVRLFHLFPIGGLVAPVKRRFSELDRSSFRATAPYVLLILIMAFGLGLRLHNLAFMSFDHDEMGLVTKSKGIYTLGFPYTPFAGEARWATTYEAVPYPLALFGLFGYSEWTMRLPACLMGTLCIGLMGLLGWRMFNWRTGLIAAFVYACLPIDIRWAQNAFYPQQCQFMALLTILLFYEAFQARSLRHGYLSAATVCFCLTYLSWEGSAFLLPCLFLGLMVIRWGDWRWLKEFHLYRCLFFIGAVVVAQYCSRTIAGVPYLQIGSGLSNLAGPSLFFLTSSYQPMFYVNKLWLSENHVFFTVFALLGLPICWGQRGYRYVFTNLVGLWICHTNFLAALAPRYCYYFQPLLVLAGIAAAVILYDRIVSLARRESDSEIAWICAHAAGIALVVLLFLQSNESVFKEYKLSSSGDTPGLMTRMGMYRYDYRDADRYVKEHLQPGDVVFPGIPHVYAYYAGKPGDYFLDTLLASKVPYNQMLGEPAFADKFGGLPVVRNLTELKEVANRARRTWLVFAPYASFEKLNNPNVLEYLDENARVVFETYRAKVLLIEGHSQIKERRGEDRRTAQTAE